MKNVVLQRYRDMVMTKGDVQLSKQTQKILRKSMDVSKTISKADLERLQTAYSLDSLKQQSGGHYDEPVMEVQERMRVENLLVDGLCQKLVETKLGKS